MRVLFALDEPGLARFRSRNIGFVFQEHHLLPQLSVLENVLVPLLAEGKPDAASVERAHNLLSRVGLAERLEHRPAELSGGERSRVAVARALIRQPVLLLADEPTANVDPAHQQQIIDMLRDACRREQIAMLLVTHSPEVAAQFERVEHLEQVNRVAGVA